MEIEERYRMFKSGKSGVYYQLDKHTKVQTSLRTNDRDAAIRIIRAANEKELTPMINRQIGMIYLSSIDPDAATRTWGKVMLSYREGRKLEGATLERLLRAERAKAMAALVN